MVPLVVVELAPRDVSAFNHEAVPNDFMTRNLLLIFVTAMLANHAHAAGKEKLGIAFFESRIRPVLIQYCYECHSAASTELKGGLRLDSRDFTRRGGESGPAVVPRDRGRSLLLKAIRRDSLEMPPNETLPQRVISDFETWIDSGAPDPRIRPPTAKEVAEISWKNTLKDRRSWWSLQPLEVAPPPHGAAHPIDAFVFAKQQAQGVHPTKTATIRTLARRLSLVLTGLPPKATELEPFHRDAIHDPETAYAGLVDRYLASPHFGEHWARHWMDVVRFSETHGYEWNHEIRDAWRFRDYLIRAFNRDVPFDQLIREHIAGDLLEVPRVNPAEAVNESLIGTAFWRFGELGHDDCVQYPEIRFDALDNQIDTFSKAFQGLTVSCARCHDHKLDAISTKDYYALVAILENCSQVVHPLDSPSRISEMANEVQALKKQIRQELGDRWIAAIDPMGKTLLDALQGRPSDAENPNRIVRPAPDKKPSRENPSSILFQFATESAEAGTPEATLASRWQRLAKDYTEAHRRREETLANRFEQWADFRSLESPRWSSSGLGLSVGPNRDGEFVLAHEGETIVAAVLSAGLHTHTLSDRLNGSLRSPWLPTEKKYISVQLVGDRRSMVRTVVDSCSLNEFAGGGLHYLMGGTPQWKTFPTSAGPSLRSFVELTTRSDNPRWPDRPGRAGSADPAVVNDYRSSFGILQAVLHDHPEGPEPDLRPILTLFEQAPPQDEAGIASVFQATAHQVVSAWRRGETSETDVPWLNWFLQVGLLPNTLEDQTSRLGRLVRRYRSIAASIPEPRVVAGLADHGGNRGFPVLLRGDAKKPGEIVPTRYLEALSGTKGFESTGSGRQQLADLITAPENPLTARVAVNRIWHHLFGRGIVATPDDFGRMGEPPTHPELLDYLASEFIKDGWSVKRLIRRIVLTDTFRQASLPDPKNAQVDPGNQLLHHYPPRRLDGEAIRDSLLVVSGRFDPQLFGPSIHPHRAKETDYRKLFSGPLDGDGRRSIYTKVTRMEGPQFLELFDFPNRMLTTGRRDRTNVPAQALALLNDPFVIQQAHFWSAKLVRLPHDSLAARIQLMFRSALGRPPSIEEEQRFEALIRSLADEASSDDGALLQDAGAWQDAAHAIFNMKELVYIL